MAYIYLDFLKIIGDKGVWFRSESVCIVSTLPSKHKVMGSNFDKGHW